jgi:flagellar biosynthesis/type III secretory pathway protein FliH
VGGETVLGDLNRHLVGAKMAEERAQALERRAEAILLEAEQTLTMRLTEAERRVKELYSQVDQATESIQAESYQLGLVAGQRDGFQAGLTAGQLEAKSLVDEAEEASSVLLSEAEKVVARIHEQALVERGELLVSAQAQILGLTFAVAKQILRAEVELSPEKILPMIEAALAKMKSETQAVLRVSPAVEALLEQHRFRLVGIVQAKDIEIISDTSFGPGDFVAQGISGTVDGRLERQVEVLERIVKTEER